MDNTCTSTTMADTALLSMSVSPYRCELMASTVNTNRSAWLPMTSGRHTQRWSLFPQLVDQQQQSLTMSSTALSTLCRAISSCCIACFIEPICTKQPRLNLRTLVAGRWKTDSWRYDAPRTHSGGQNEGQDQHQDQKQTRRMRNKMLSSRSNRGPPSRAFRPRVIGTNCFSGDMEPRVKRSAPPRARATCDAAPVCYHFQVQWTECKNPVIWW